MTRNKSTKFSCLCLLLILCTCTSVAQTIKFEGTADKKYDGDKIVIYQRNFQDSATIKDGHFSFVLPFKEPTIYMFFSKYESHTKGYYNPYSIMVTEPGTIKINADVADFANTTSTGSEENELYQKTMAEMNNGRQKIIDHLTEKYGKDFVMNRNPDTSSTKYKEMMKEYEEMANADEKEQKQQVAEFIKAHPASFTSIYVLNMFATMLDIPEVERLYATLSPKYKKTKTGESIEKTIQARKMTAIGSPAPLFSMPDTSGNIVKLSDFRGKYVLVDFWASWCGPCRAENPNLRKTFEKYKNKNFTVLGVSLDQPGKKASWLAAIHKDKLDWTQVSDLKFWDNEAAVLYGVKAIPANFLVDPNGNIIAQNLRGEDLSKKLEEVLGGQ